MPFRMNNLLMHLLSLLRVAVDLLEMLKAMRLDLAFDREGMGNLYIWINCINFCGRRDWITRINYINNCCLVNCSIKITDLTRGFNQRLY